jgi:putative DNA-invertase from lambdoid prophage Rac
MAENPKGLNARLKAAVYCRVSTNDQDCERQRRELEIYAEKCGYEIVEIFLETGSGMRRDRLQRRKVIAMARARSINLVLVSELTRWGRSTVDLIESLHELHSYGVSLIAQNGFQFDLSTPHGQMLAGVMASMAQFERDLLRERVTSGIANAKARGQVFGRPRGGKIPKLAPKILILRGRGLSLAEIAAELKISKSAVAAVCRQVVPEDSFLQGDQVSLDI